MRRHSTFPRRLAVMVGLVALLVALAFGVAIRPASAGHVPPYSNCLLFFTFYSPSTGITSYFFYCTGPDVEAAFPGSCAVTLREDVDSGGNHSTAILQLDPCEPPPGEEGPPAEDEDQPPPAPGLWLAGVCEPNDGFSDPAYGEVMTWGSDANGSVYGSRLYAAAGPDGPWYETDFEAAPYVISRDQMEALTALVGLSDYHDLWLRASDGGTPVNVGSAIADREAHMDDLCGE